MGKSQEFVEPFAGGAIVGLTMLFEGLTDRLTLVERDEDVAAVWRTIVNGSGDKLADAISNFVINHESVQATLSKRTLSLFDRAFTTIVKNRVQRGGILAPGASMMKNGENGKGLASRWYPETLSNRIRAIVKLRKKIQVIQGNGIEAMRHKLNNENAVFFVDPPYVKAGQRLYRYSEVDHEELFAVSSKMKGEILMSYDESDGIKDLARRNGFEVATVKMKNTHHNIKKELLIGRDFSWLDSGIHQREFVADSLFEGFLTDGASRR